MRSMKKWAALLLAMMMFPWMAFAESAEFAAAAESAEQAEAAAAGEPAEPAESAEPVQIGGHTLACRTYPYYRAFDDEESVESEMSLYFIDGVDDLPYVALSEYMAFFSNLMTDYDEWDPIDYSIERVEEDSSEAGAVDSYFVTRPDNGTTMVVMPRAAMIMIDSYNLFTARPGFTSLVSALDIPTPEEVDLDAILDGISALRKSLETGSLESVESLYEEAYGKQDPAKDHTFFISAGSSFDRYGSGTYLDCGEYGISFYSLGGECYLPLQTMNDLFLNQMYFHIIFNGEFVVGACYGCSLLEKAFEAEPREMSLSLAMYNYSELIFLLDTFYGLKAEHGIDSFRDMIASNRQLLKGFMSYDAGEFDNALAKLLCSFLDDRHSGFNRSSWRNPDNDIFSDFLRLFANLGYSSRKSLKLDVLFGDARAEVYPGGVPGYEEIGDTAFITFDTFYCEVNDIKDYYELGLPGSLEDCGQDTIRLIQYANSRIQREDSPIRNVVIDLSHNGGGDVPAALAVMCWYLGEASIALRDTMTGAMSIMYYKCDLNLNEFSSDDDGDSLVGRYNLYCIISPESFSCGNLVPAFFKDSCEVTLIGQRSGGGSCVVLPCTSASGTRFQISGTSQIALVKNGTFYNVDDGIDPDIVLTKPASFYDRPGLVELIHNAK